METPDGSHQTRVPDSEGGPGPERAVTVVLLVALAACLLALLLIGRS